MRSTQATLAVDARHAGETACLRLEGDLDITSSPLLLPVVEHAIAGRRDPQCRLLVVDMSGVGFAVGRSAVAAHRARCY